MLIGREKQVQKGIKQALSQGEATYIDLGKFTIPILREFYQASCGIEGFFGSAVPLVEEVVRAAGWYENGLFTSE